MKHLGILLLALFGGALALIVITLGGGLLWMRGSLPPLDGAGTLPGLSGPATLDRDSLGIAVARSRSYDDALRLQGFAHGQDRYFQMDLLRRIVAGELAELLGEVALASDRRYRPYGYREAARTHLRRLPPGERASLTAYVQGVNAGLRSLARVPPEYVVMRGDPEPWREEDSLLVILYFYDALSVNYRVERHLHTLHSAVPGSLAAFLAPDASRFDAPVRVDGEEDPTGGYLPLPLPGPEVVDLRGEEPAPRPPIRIHGDLPGGSNAWAVRPEVGLPVVAGDPHLPLTMPNIWYRAELHWDAGRVMGAGPPGLPGVLVGLSDHLAWGVTAALVDQTDLVLVEVDPSDTLSYRTPEGAEAFGERREVVLVRGLSPDTVRVRSTRWGPVLYQDHDGRPLALRSPAYDEGGVSLGYLELARSRDVEAAQERLAELGGPGLSVILADRRGTDGAGRIGWIVTGALPDRRGMDGRLPVSWATGGVGWFGYRNGPHRPSVVLEEPGYLRTANQRLIPLPQSRTLSQHWELPTRARRIDQLLEDALSGEPEAHARHQLDTRSLVHDPYRDLLLEWIPSDETDAPLARARAAAAAWDGTASLESREFPVLAVVREALRNAVLSPLLAPAAELDSRFVYGWTLADEPALRILEERPDHLLPPPHEEWGDFVREVVAEAVEALYEAGSDGDATPWGELNRARINHPFGELSTALGWILNLSRDPLPGWAGAIRAQAPSYGQSLRFTGRPGEPETALFQMPGGQSGHFLSPFFRAGHEAWVRGDPAPMQAGPSIHSLRFRAGS